MKTLLTLSGERPPASLFRDFPGAGLIRSEYLFRFCEEYPTATSAPKIIGEYFEYLRGVAPDLPLWYRTLEVTTSEANVLAGVEQSYPGPENDLMGLRGVRRSIAHPEALDAELDALAQMRETMPAIGVIAPFVATEEEVAWFAGRVRERMGDEVPIASMIETPAALLACAEILRVPGVNHVVVGCNDLSSLLDARRRVLGESTRLSASLATAIRMVRDATRAAGATMTVAGYLTPEIVAVAKGVDADAVSVHYCDLPAIAGPAYADLPDLDRVAHVKQLTRRRMRENTV